MSNLETGAADSVPSGRRWNILLALLFTGLSLAGMLVGNMLGLSVMVAVGVVRGWYGDVAELDWNQAMQIGARDGDIVLFSVAAGAPFMIGLPLLFAWLRRFFSGGQDSSIADYFALRRPALLSLLLWNGALIAYVFAFDAVKAWAGLDEIPEVILEIFRTVSSPITLVFVVGLLAPFFEEWLFRGFLLRSFDGRRVRQIVGALLSAVLFAVIHLQYEWYDMLGIVGVGLLLAGARLQSGSLWTPIVMHVVNNLLSVYLTWQLLNTP